MNEKGTEKLLNRIQENQFANKKKTESLWIK